MPTKYAGADWVKGALKKEMSPLGERVADLLGQAFLGIYHISYSLKKVNWADPWLIEFNYYGRLCTYDCDELTRLVVLSFDMMVRIEIAGVGPGYLKLRFWKREHREGAQSSRIPHIEDQLAMYRRHYGPPLPGEPELHPELAEMLENDSRGG